VAHTYGGCPLVRKELGSEDSPVAGPWCEIQRRIAVIESLLMEEIHNVTFTTIVFTNTSKETLQNVTVGSGMAICLTSDDRGNSPGVTKISADVSQAGSLRDQLAYEITELQRSAGLIAGSATQVGQPESGVARAFAFNEIEARLARLAEIGEGFERRIMELAAKGFGFPAADPVNWPREFAPMDLAAAVEAAGSLKINGAPPVLVSAAWEKLARHSLQIEPGSEKDAALAEQLQSMAAAPRGPFTSGEAALAQVKPTAKGVPAADAAAKETSLNGAQVQSLVEVIGQVAREELPAAAAREIIATAFPAMDPGAINRAVAAADKFTPKTTPPQ
jgi:hypothetical protein